MWLHCKIEKKKSLIKNNSKIELFLTQVLSKKNHISLHLFGKLKSEIIIILNHKYYKKNVFLKLYLIIS